MTELVASAAPPAVPGIVEGSLTVHSEPGGGVSLRVTVGVGGREVVELLISAECARDLNGSLATSAARSANPDPIASYSCRVGIASR